MDRTEMLRRASTRRDPWDMVIVGGGATGAGIALDAAARRYSVLLIDRQDFGAGTSSRSTKLVHGGVRYLRQGHLGLVLDALRERGRLRRNAPHLVHDLAFVLPCYRRWDLLQYGLGLTAYDVLAGRERFGRSRLLSSREVLRQLPTARPDGLRGGVLYHDGRFDDARLLIHLLMTAADHGATVLNHAPAVGLTRDQARITGVMVRDAETGAEFHAAARVVINAAGPFCDEVRRMADPQTRPLLAASQGSHVVLDRSFLPSEAALLVPQTPDGRVLFAIPWHGHTLIGTTDVPIPQAPAEPRPTLDEVDFILETAGRYLAQRPRREDVLSMFAGVRPLVRGDGATTAALSRDHLIRHDHPGLITITGGKWTTYRLMAEQCVDRAAVVARLPRRSCPTRELPIHGATSAAERFGELAAYGADATRIQAMIAARPELGDRLHHQLPYRCAEVVWAVKTEMARTVEDVLTRRTRAMFLNAAAAMHAAPLVARLIAGELGRSEAWEAEQVRAFTELARGYTMTN